MKDETPTVAPRLPPEVPLLAMLASKCESKAAEWADKRTAPGLDHAMAQLFRDVAGTLRDYAEAKVTLETRLHDGRGGIGLHQSDAPTSSKARQGLAQSAEGSLVQSIPQADEKTQRD